MATNIGHGTKQYRLLSPPRREPSAVGAWDVLALLRAGGCELLCELACESGVRVWCVRVSSYATLAAVAV